MVVFVLLNQIQLQQNSEYFHVQHLNKRALILCENEHLLLEHRVESGKAVFLVLGYLISNVVFLIALIFLDDVVDLEEKAMGVVVVGSEGEVVLQLRVVQERDELLPKEGVADERQDALGHHVTAHQVGMVGTLHQHLEQLIDV